MQSLSRTKFHTVMDECLVGCCLFATQDLTTAVAFVGEQRMTDVTHVCPNLMGTACFQMTFHQCYRAEAFQHLVMGDGRFTHFAVHRIDVHLQTVFLMSANVARNGALIVCKGTPHEGIVFASGRVIEELFAQTCLCVCGLCDDQQPACVFVYAVCKSNVRIVRIEALIVA